jgi:hypothetical protein
MRGAAVRPSRVDIGTSPLTVVRPREDAGGRNLVRAVLAAVPAPAPVPPAPAPPAPAAPAPFAAPPGFAFPAPFGLLPGALPSFAPYG